MAQATVPLPLSKNPAPISYAMKNEAPASAVSWAAVSGGAFVTAALLLSLSALGAGMGLSSLSPWSNSGVSPSSVGMGALLWLAVIETLACAIGGYVAGRLRTKWVDVHSDEVYFRDTAHGFLVWAVAFVILAAFLSSVGTVLAGRDRSANAAPSAGLVTDANRYFIDSLFRSDQSSSIPDEALRAEIGVIFGHALHQRELAADDRNYVADMVATKTALARPEAERRVTEVFGRDQQAVDNARKAVAHSLYWMFVALLLGAFAASLAATLGGRRRDQVHA
jgi:hypothetical protein